MSKTRLEIRCAGFLGGTSSSCLAGIRTVPTTSSATAFAVWPMAPLGSIFMLLFIFSNSLKICSSRKLEIRTKEAKFEPALQAKYASSSIGVDPSQVIQLSWHPRVFLYEGFLSDDECDHLISMAEGNLQKSYSGNSTMSSFFTGSGMFLSRGQDEIVRKIEERISAWTFLPKENGEDLNILHYGTNESYQPHLDYNQDKSKTENGGHRVVTILMYLSNVTHGGETIFLLSELHDTQYKDDTWSNCAMTGYAVKPVKGDALLIFNLYPNATPDESSIHGGCKVLEGEKWIATKRIHARAYSSSKSPPSASDDECSDEDNNCANWAATGECQRNPVYMLGTPDYYGTCRKSCGAC